MASAAVSRLVVHLDVNGVVLGMETIGERKSLPDEYASVMLANSIKAQWEQGGPSTSYKDHVWDVLLPGPNSDLQLREKRKGILRNFVRIFPEDHPLREKYAALVKVLSVSPFFSGFDVLVGRLKKLKGLESHLIIRTFGRDGDLVERYLRERHPKIELQRGEFKGRVFHYGEESTDSVQKIYKLFQEGHWLVQDDFNYWRERNESGRGGKLFPFSLRDGVRSIFLDDNARIVASPDERTILDPVDIDAGRSVSTQEASRHVVHVDPVEAALDDQYLSRFVFG